VSLFGSWGRVQRALGNMESGLGTQASILDVRRHLVGAIRKIGGRTTVPTHADRVAPGLRDDWETLALQDAVCGPAAEGLRDCARRLRQQERICKHPWAV
jgi:hypothetical protein